MRVVGGGRWPWGPMVFLLISLFPKCIKFPEMKVPRTTESPGFQGHGFPSPPTPGGITIGPREDPSPCPMLGDFFPAPEPGIEYLEGSHQSQKGVVDY